MSNRLPSWFKQETPDVKTFTEVQELLDSLNLHTICESARCPNVGQCLSQRTAAFLILGDICTRNCTFCAVTKGTPAPPDPSEPSNLLEAVRKLGLKYTVITSVTRDDLPDGGASHFTKTIRHLRDNIAEVTVEVLIPDFLGSKSALKMVIDSGPQVINHNVETVRRLYPEVRPKADYNRSVGLLARIKEVSPNTVTKSGLMLGLGETREEVTELMSDLREADCDLLTIGQYLQPSVRHHPVVRYILPDEFTEYEIIGRNMGFTDVASAPLVRSSYKAAEMYSKTRASLSK
jgi:lipoic acid synthetase